MRLDNEAEQAIVNSSQGKCKYLTDWRITFSFASQIPSILIYIYIAFKSLATWLISQVLLLFVTTDPSHSLPYKKMKFATSCFETSAVAPRESRPLRSSLNSPIRSLWPYLGDVNESLLRRLYRPRTVHDLTLVLLNQFHS